MISVDVCIFPFDWEGKAILPSRPSTDNVKRCGPRYKYDDAANKNGTDFECGDDMFNDDDVAEVEGGCGDNDNFEVKGNGRDWDGTVKRDDRDCKDIDMGDEKGDAWNDSFSDDDITGNGDDDDGGDGNVDADDGNGVGDGGGDNDDDVDEEE